MPFNYYLLSPLSAVIFSVVFFGAFHLLSPYYHFGHQYSLDSYLLFTGNLLLLYTCPVLYGLSRKRNTEIRALEETTYVLSKPGISFFLTFFVLVSLLGGVLRMWDILINRGDVLLSNMSAHDRYHLNRDLEASTFLGLVSAGMYPMAIPTMTLLCLQRRLGISVGNFPIKIMALLCAIVVPLVYMLLLGKRGSIFSIFLLALIGAPYVWGRFYSARSIAWIGGGFSLLLVFFTLFFSIRMVEQGKEIELAVFNAGYTELLDPTPAMHNFFSDTRSGAVHGAGLAYVSISGYLTHGVSEFLYVVDHFSNEHTYGYASFNVLYKLAKMLNLYDSRLGDSDLLFPRPGTYTTLFGSLYVDYGMFSLIVSFFIGFVTCVVHNRSLTKPWWVALYFYFYLVVFLAPSISFLLLFGGAYFLITFTIFGIAFGMVNACSGSSPQ